MGIANPTASVTVNGNTAYRKGEYFDYALPVSNGSAPQYPQVTVVSSFPPGQSDQGNVFVPRTPEVFGYDPDGNLTNDGRWSYTWDAENRLVKVESLETAPAGSRRRLEFMYDNQSRRIVSRITNLDTGSVLSSNKLRYDGWIVASERTNTQLSGRFVLGPDLRAVAGCGRCWRLAEVT